jgi:hypothetical protein
MKHTSNTLKILGLALVIGLGVSAVSAFTNPGSTSPGANVPAPINTGINNQTKDGGILSEKYFLSDLSFFTKTLLPGIDSWMNIGGALNVAPGGINNGGSTIPLTIDLTDRAIVTKDGTQGQNAINFITGESSCPTVTTFINDHAPAFEFISASNNTGHADLIAGQLQLVGGSPQDNSVLAAVDTNGNAVWAKLVVQNGVLKVINNQTGSPVVTDALCGPAPTTYSWSSGTWGQCVSYGGIPTFSADWEPVSNNYTVASAAVYGSNLSSLGKYCPAPATFTYITGIQLRTVICVDSNGTPAPNESYCTTPKPDIIQNCSETKNIEYRVTSTTQSLNSGRIYSQSTPLNNNCIYRKPMDTTPFLPPSDVFLDLFASDCKVLPISNRSTNISGYYTAGTTLSQNFAMAGNGIYPGDIPNSHCGYVTTPDADYMGPPSGFHPGAIDYGTLHRSIFEYRLKP